MRYVMLMAVLLVPTTGYTQEVGIYDGNWEVQLINKGVSHTITLNLKGNSGTLGGSPWVNSRFGQCFNRDMPVNITQATKTDLTFDVTRSKIIPGCVDTNYKLVRVDDNSLQGTSHREDVNPDTAVTLIRK